MKKYFNKYLNLGVSEELCNNQITQVRMVNFATLFITFAGLTFFFKTLSLGNLTLSLVILSFPILYLLIPILHFFKLRIFARNFFFLGTCLGMTILSIIDNPNSFTINYFFGIAMVSFVVYNKAINRVLGLLLCIALYIGIGFIQRDLQVKLAFDPVIYIMDAMTLFVGILLCLTYFQRISKNQLDIIVAQKIELEKININKNKLISIITHDIRNPIGSLNQVLKLEENENLSNEELNYLLTHIREEFIHQFESIENLLKWAQNQLTEIKTNVELVNVGHLLDDLMKELNYAVTKKEIKVKIQTCGEDNINIDKNHLLIILRNLLNNAIKFTKESGKITIVTSKLNTHYTIEIIDNGIGFPSGIHSDFREVDITSQQIGTASEKGNGIGLMICKELALMNNAKLLKKNNLDSGATLRLEIALV